MISAKSVKTIRYKYDITKLKKYNTYVLDID